MKFSIKGYDLVKHAYMGMTHENMVPNLPKDREWGWQFIIGDDGTVELEFEDQPKGTSDAKKKKKEEPKPTPKKKPYQAGGWMKG